MAGPSSWPAASASFAIKRNSSSATARWRMKLQIEADQEIGIQRPNGESNGTTIPK